VRDKESRKGRAEESIRVKEITRKRKQKEKEMKKKHN
jgi:hypothetical protein